MEDLVKDFSDEYKRAPTHAEVRGLEDVALQVMQVMATYRCQLPLTRLPLPTRTHPPTAVTPTAANGR